MQRDQASMPSTSANDAHGAVDSPSQEGRAAGEQMAAEAERLAEQVQAGAAEARAEIANLEQRTRRLIQERPVGALVAALVAGYLVGRISARLS
jgi:hypothetical protein